MPTITFTLAGLPDVMQALDDLTPALVNDVERMQREAAEAAAAKIRSLYPYRKGNLAKGVQTRRLLKGRMVAAMVVENTWWLASIYDHGVQTVRETKKGYFRGTQPARPVFSRTMRETRRAVDARTVEILRQHGLMVLHAAA
jgi:hypothetical protein